MKKILCLLFVFCASQGLPTLENTPVSNAPLVNQESKPFQLYDLKGKYLFISFVYTRCPFPNMCPLTVTLNKALYRKWKDTKGAPELHFLFVTLDPKNDSASALKKFAQSRGLDLKHFTLATGNPQTLAAMATEFKVIGIPEQGFIAHNMKNILLDPNLNIIKIYEENQWKPEQVLAELRK